MSNRLLDILLGLTPRERLALAIAVLLAAPLAIAFAVVLPLAEARRAAEQAEAEALAVDAWVRARAAEQAPLLAAPEITARAPIGSGGIEQRLIQGGLRDAVSDLGARADGRVELHFETVGFVRLANWLSAVHPRWGYDIESFRVEASDRPGDVAAWLTLVP
ncbi:type II secretion system protein GspM [Salipiger abyssi]|uniref:type II secretion system protein GspM n=1 Tax=Salipiger abyssi TaxID=1250539 RepID=UPI0040589668